MFTKAAKLAPQSLYAFLGVFAVYLILRLVAWNNTVLLEDTDSLGYMRWIKVFMTFDIGRIIDIDPDFTPFYLFFSSLFSLVAPSIEIGARLTSLAFSLLLFFSILGIGRLIAKPCEITPGLLLLSFSSALIPLSFAILTEPSYIATVYLGLWLFWMQYKNPTVGSGILLGIVFGLSFLNRIEGIIYLAVIPFLQMVHFLFVKERAYSLKKILVWAAVYIVVFSAVIAPQIWRVSNIVGEFSLNGREVWSVIINTQPDKSWGEKFYALDYSPSEANIHYLKRHPEAWKEMVSTFDPMSYVRNFVKNTRKLLRSQLNVITGPLGLFFFACGLYALFRSRLLYENFLVLTFLGASIIPPLLHTALPRHLLIVTPLIWLVAGIGIMFIARHLACASGRLHLNSNAIAAILTAVVISVSAADIRSAVLDPPVQNREYSLIELEQPVKIVNEIAEDVLGRQAVIVAHTGYLAYFTNSRQVYYAYAELSPFLNYVELNHADFLYIQHNRVKDYPFFSEYLQGGLPQDYIRVYRGEDADGGTVELYWRPRDHNARNRYLKLKKD